MRERGVVHELILGGQRSGKSRCAEARAMAWLEALEVVQAQNRSAVLIATASAGDDEMRERIQAHRQARLRRLPALQVDEVPCDLVQAVRRHSAPHRMVVIDCLLLWLTNLLMPMHGDALTDTAWATHRDALCAALVNAPGPVVLVSNEIGLGIAPLSREARRFVDALGELHQRVAAVCGDLTLMVAGHELAVKRAA